MKTFIWLGLLVGGIAGGYVPVLFGSSLFSMASLLGNTVGSVVGILVGYKIAQHTGL